MPAQPFGPPTGPPAAPPAFAPPGSHPPGWAPPPPKKASRAWAAAIGAGVFIAFRVGLFVFSLMGNDDPSAPATAVPPALEQAAATDALDNPLEAVLGERYDTGRQVTSCAVPHQGEVITALILEDREADRASADRRCRWYVDHELGGSIPRGTDVYAQVPAGAWDRGFLPVSCVVEARPGQPLLTGRLRQPRPTD